MAFTPVARRFGNCQKIFKQTMLRRMKSWLVGWLVGLLVGCLVTDGYIDFPGKSNDLLVFVAKFHPCLLCTLSSTWQTSHFTGQTRPWSFWRAMRFLDGSTCWSWHGQNLKVCSCLGMQNNPVGWYDMIWYDTIRYDTIRYDTVSYEMIWDQLMSENVGLSQVCGCCLSFFRFTFECAGWD